MSSTLIEPCLSSYDEVHRDTSISTVLFYAAIVLLGRPKYSFDTHCPWTNSTSSLEKLNLYMRLWHLLIAWFDIAGTHDSAALRNWNQTLARPHCPKVRYVHQNLTLSSIDELSYLMITSKLVSCYHHVRRRV